MMPRRTLLKQAAALGVSSMLLSTMPWLSQAFAAGAPAILKRKIPSTGESIPAIGLGTSGSFEVAVDSAEYKALQEVLQRFFAGGATLIDTAPTYGNAEDVLGKLLATSGAHSRAFIATKLSRVKGRAEGLEQFRNTLRLLQTDKVELLQVHNLGDWKTQIEVARQLKAEGKVKYVGVTHYVDSAHAELAEVVQASKPDFLQINYSVTHRGVEQRVLPLAKDLGVAVLTNRNFDDGALFERIKGKALPSWAAEIGINSWAQVFLKFVLSHEAVTAVIPATGKPERQSDNLQAGSGPLLSVAQRADVVRIVA